MEWKTYDFIRAPLKFEETLLKLQRIHDYKTANLEKPLIKIQGVWPAIRESPEEFYNTFAPIVDLIAFNPLIDYLHNDKDIVYEDNLLAPSIFKSHWIQWASGDVQQYDFMDINIGDINSQSIHEIWHGKAFQNVRQIHEQPDGFISIKPCKNCYYPRKAEADEQAMINGRLVNIENYINRAQTVGK